MPKNRQIIPPKQVSLPTPPPHSYTVMQFRSTQNDDDDDDDICPVCESECTCKNNTQAAPSLPSVSTSAPTPVPLKIKLPARNVINPAPKASTIKRTRPRSNKPKQTTVGSATVDGNSSNYVLVHHPGPFSTLGHQLGTPSATASTSTTLSLRDTSPLTPEPELERPSTDQGKPKRPTKAITPKSRKKTTTTKAKPKSRPATSQKKLTVGTKSRKNKDSTWTTGAARRSKGKRSVQTSSNESQDDFSENEDAYVTRMVVESDGTESVQFPTFVSAISTTSDNDDSASMTTDSFDSDSSIRAEEENLILVEQRAKVRREILNNEEAWHMEKKKWDHLKNNNNWEIRPRKRSVGPEQTDSGTESESESEGQEEDEEEEEGDDDDDDDDDADVRYGRGLVTGWQSDDDDFDAELLFATLFDSSGPGSDADAEDEEDSADDQSENSDLSAISITEAAAAGLLSSPFGAGCPLVVTEDWDGRLVFANGLKDGQGVLDIHFEVDAAQRHRNIREAMEVDAEATDENLEVDDEDEDDIISDDGGETTDDMLDHRPGISTPQGIVPIPFRCPTPPVTSIDPLSTFSPIVSSRRNKLIKGTLPSESPKPADILAGKVFWDNSSAPEKESNTLHSPAASNTAASPPETASSQSRQMPSMGSFAHVPTDPKRRAIIDGSKTVVFSPFTRIRRVRRQPGRGRKRNAAGNDIFPYAPKRPRQSSLPGSSRALMPADAEEEGSPLVQSSPELPLPTTTSIGLDDVLDASFLDSDDYVEPAANTSGERHLRNLNRWDRVPMSTFRRSRTTHIDGNSIRISTLAPPNDGVSYGSAGGRVLRKSPLGAALWQTNARGDGPSRQSPGTVAVSPVIFPVRDGEQTPTASQYSDFLQKSLPSDAGSSRSRKQKRKEKKRSGLPSTSVSAPTSTPNDFRCPPANVPPLNL